MSSKFSRRPRVQPTPVICRPATSGPPIPPDLVPPTLWAHAFWKQDFAAPCFCLFDVVAFGLLHAGPGPGVWTGTIGDAQQKIWIRVYQFPFTDLVEIDLRAEDGALICAWAHWSMPEMKVTQLFNTGLLNFYPSQAPDTILRLQIIA